MADQPSSFPSGIQVTGRARFTGPVTFTAETVSGTALTAATVPATALTTTMQLGFIPLDLTTVRLISANDIQNTTEAGVPDGNTTPSLLRVSTSTDKALRLNWVASNSTEVQFAPIPLPPDLDDTADLTIHLLVNKDSNTDTTANIDVQVYFNVGDTECGDVTAAITETTAAPAEKTVTVASGDIPAAPGVMNVSLVPSAHTTDAIRVYAAWISYSRK